MNRREFTINLANLLLEMGFAGDNPVLQDVHREAEMQNMYFKKELSKCDGYIKISGHQLSMCADIYLVTTRPDGTARIDFEWDKNKAIKWHNRWVEMGGRPMIEFEIIDEYGVPHTVHDYPHFDGRSYD